MLSDYEKKILLDVFPKGIVALDLETTGLSPTYDKIIEIAAVKLQADGQTKTFSSLINPEIIISEKSTAIHHITNDMVKDSPLLSSVLPKFCDFLGSIPMVAHNARFDAGFMIYSYHVNKIPFGETDIFDSVRFARASFKNDAEDTLPENYKLNTLANYFQFGIENYHRALDDAAACLKVFCHSINKIEKSKARDFIRSKAHLFNLRDFKKSNLFEIPEHLKPILVKISEGNQITIEYRGTTDGNKLRLILPLSFLPMPSGMVLYAKCLTTNTMKSYAVKKIKSIL